MRRIVCLLVFSLLLFTASVGLASNADSLTGFWNINYSDGKAGWMTLVAQSSGDESLLKGQIYLPQVSSVPIDFTGPKVMDNWLVPGHTYGFNLQAAPVDRLIFTITGSSSMPLQFTGSNATEWAITLYRVNSIATRR